MIRKLFAGKKGSLAFVLSLVMVAQSISPVTVLAQEAGSAVYEEETDVDAVTADAAYEEITGDPVGPATNSLSGSGTEQDPYLIASDADWSIFCDALDDTDNYGSFSEKYVKLVNSIKTDRMASGTFKGNFDGGNNTITVNYGSEDAPLEIDSCAPFRYVSGTSSIKNLYVEGVIYTTKDNAGGLVGYADATDLKVDNCHTNMEIHTKGLGGFLIGQTPMAEVSTTITNCTTSGHVYAEANFFGGISGFTGGKFVVDKCRSNAVIEFLVDEKSTGGLIGYARAKYHTNIIITDSVFDGSILGNDTHVCYGISNGRLNGSGSYTIKNSIFAPEQLTVNRQDGRTICCQYFSLDITDCYYTQSLGDNQNCIQVYETLSENEISKGINAVNKKTYYLKGVTVSGPDAVYEYTGKPVTVDYAVVDEATGELIDGQDYTAIIKNAKGEAVKEVEEAGDYTLTLTGNETVGYYGSYSQDFTVKKRAVTVTALPQTVMQNEMIDNSVEMAVLNGAPDDHVLAGVTLTSTDTAQPTGEGVITPSDAVIKSGDKDVTANYEITYVDGTLSVNALPVEPVKPVSSFIHETIATDVNDEKKNEVVIDLYYSKSVSYNGKKHVAKGYSKVNKSSVDDVTVSLNSVSLKDIADANIKFKNNKFAAIKNGKTPMFTIGYKAKKGVSKENKAIVKAVNKFMKAKSFGFTIDAADLSKAKLVEFAAKNGKVKKAVVEVNGVTLKLSKKDFDVTANADGTFTLKGKGNFTGTMTAK